MQQRNELARLADLFSNGDGLHKTAVPGLTCIRFSEPSIPLPNVYEPSLCVIVQGRKRVSLEGESYEYAPSQYLAVSVDLPVMGEVTEASEDMPYLCFLVDIDKQQLAELMVKARLTPDAMPNTERGIFLGRVDHDLGDCVLRFARLLEQPQDIPILASMIQREIYYRLLSGEHGHTIGQLALHGSHMQRISEAIRELRAN